MTALFFTAAILTLTTDRRLVTKAGLIGTSLACPPVGLALSVAALLLD